MVNVTECLESNATGCIVLVVTNSNGRVKMIDLRKFKYCPNCGDYKGLLWASNDSITCLSCNWEAKNTNIESQLHEKWQEGYNDGHEAARTFFDSFVDQEI